MTLYDYISTNNPHEANDLLRNYGFTDSDSISTISSRLKMIVRNHKEEGLKEISKLHPDRKLISSFINEVEPDEKFLNATGRTPDFADPNVFQEDLQEDIQEGFQERIVEPANNFANERIQDLKEIQKEALVELNRIKRDIDKQKENRYRDRNRDRDRDRANNNKGLDLSTNTMLMLGIAFAIGYLIGKK